jgi:hypothetical protein
LKWQDPNAIVPLAVLLPEATWKLLDAPNVTVVAPVVPKSGTPLAKAKGLLVTELVTACPLVASIATVVLDAATCAVVPLPPPPPQAVSVAAMQSAASVGISFFIGFQSLVQATTDAVEAGPKRT